MNTTVKLVKHYPVLLNEILSIISPLYGGTFIDCTFGQGGYSKEILKNKNNCVIAIDRDIDVINQAKNLEKKFKNRFIFKNLKFSQLDLLDKDNSDLRGVIFDLGYSLSQIKDTKKGMSFNYNTKLNMQLGLNDFSADDVINKMSGKNLYKIFKFFGEEKKSKIISKLIVKRRQQKNLNTKDLVTIIDKVYRGKKRKTHNATKVFQSLRIFVNKEISELIKGLINAFNILPIGGIIIVVSFHSIEDKIVKYFFKNYSKISNTSRYLPKTQNENFPLELIVKKPIVPSLQETTINPPSRSAKLRYVFKKKSNFNFEDFKNKFSYLLDIENLDSEII